jgi:hypothetical protein
MKTFIQWWDRNTNFHPVLQSRIVLYIFFFFSVLTLFGYALHGEYVFAIIFFIVGFLTSFFSKNMIVVQFMSLAVTNILIQGLQSKKEGLQAKDDDEEDDKVNKVADLTKKLSSSSDVQAKKDIKNLLDLQLKLMTGFNSLQPVLKDVETAISSMRNNSALQ